MKKTFLKLSFAVVILLSVSSCKKNSSSKSKTELLTQKAWIQSNQETESGGSWQIDDGFASAEACDKDDQLIFRTDKTYEQNEGASKCDEAAAQVIEQGLWNFTDNETKLTFSGGIIIIDRLDENTLVFTLDAPDENTGLNYRATFRH